MVSVWVFDVFAAAFLAGTALMGASGAATNAAAEPCYVLDAALDAALDVAHLRLAHNYDAHVSPQSAGAYLPVILARKGQATGERSLSFILGNMLSAGGSSLVLLKRETCCMQDFKLSCETPSKETCTFAASGSMRSHRQVLCLLPRLTRLSAVPQ